MKQLISLTKTLLRSNNRFFNLDIEDKNSLYYILAFILTITSLAWVMVGYATYCAYQAFAKVDNQNLLLSVSLIAISFITLVSSIIYIISVFYFSNDIDLLIPMPIKSYKILTAKFLVVLIYQYIIDFFVLIPVWFIYGFEMKLGIMYYIYGAVIFFLVPIVPIIVASILLIIIMRLFSFGKNKEIMKAIGAVLSIILTLSFTYLAKYGDSFFDTYIVNNTNLFNTNILDSVPYLKLIIAAVENCNNYHGLFSMLFFSFFNAALFFCFLVLGNKIYLKSIIGSSEISTKESNVKEKDLLKYLKYRNQFLSYVSKEIKVIIRNPIYLINCVITPFIIPLVIMIAFITQKGIKVVFQMIKDLQSNINISTVIGFFIVFIIILVGTNLVALTSISREKNAISIAKYIPMSYKKQVLAKAIVSFIIVSVPCFLILMCGMIFFRLSIFYCIIILLLAMPISFYSAMNGVLVDLKDPNINWQNETQMIKQNMNVIVANISTYLKAGIISYCIIHYEPSLVTIVAFYFIVMVVMYLFLYMTFNAKSEQCFEKLTP